MASHRRAWVGLAVVCLGVLVGPFDTTVNTAFPVITAAFSLPLRDIQWVVIAFVLAQSSFLLVFGHLGDRFGHRRIFALGLAASVLAHAAVALAPDFRTLVGTRVLQGIAVGVTLSCAPALATLLFPPQRQVQVLALYAAATSLAMALGPWLGGLLLEAFGWPGVFWFRVPLALAALLLLPLLPASRQVVAGRGSRYDWGGAVGLTAVLGGLALALVELTRPGAAAATGLAIGSLTIAGAVLLVRHEARVAQPVLRVEPFRSPRFRGIQGASVAVHGACFANLLLLPYALTLKGGVSLATAGLLLSTYPGGAMLGSLLAGRLARRWSPARLMTVGLAGAGAGLLFTAAVLSGPSAPLLLAIGMMASGLGQGLFQVGYMDATISMLPVEERGTAGSLVTVTRLVGVLLGVTGIGWLQGLTGHYGLSFAVLGGALALFAVAFASAPIREGARGR
jgi:MFS family permease